MPKVSKSTSQATRSRHFQQGAKKKPDSVTKRLDYATIEESGTARGLQSAQILRAKQLLSEIATMPYNELYEIVVGEFNKNTIGIPRKAHNPFFAFTAVYRHLNYRDAAFRDVKTPETKEFSVAWGHIGQTKDTFSVIHSNLREDIKDKDIRHYVPSMGPSEHIIVVELADDTRLISSPPFSNATESPCFPALHWTEHKTPESFIKQDRRLSDESVTIETGAPSLQPETPTTIFISGGSPDMAETIDQLQGSVLQHPNVEASPQQLSGYNSEATTGLSDDNFVDYDLASDFFDVNDEGFTLSTFPPDLNTLDKVYYDDVNSNPLAPPIHDSTHSPNYGKSELSLSPWVVEATQVSTFGSSMAGGGYSSSLLFTSDF